MPDNIANDFEKNLELIIEYQSTKDTKILEELYEAHKYIINNYFTSINFGKINYDFFIIRELLRRELIASFSQYSRYDGNFRAYVLNRMKKKLNSFLTNNPNPMLDPKDLKSLRKIIGGLGVIIAYGNYNLFRCELELLPSKVKVALKSHYVFADTIAGIVKKINDRSDKPVDEKTIKEALDRVKARIINLFPEKVNNTGRMITEYYPCSDIETIKSAIGRLTIVQQNDVYYAFGKELDRPREDFDAEFPDLCCLISNYLNVNVFAVSSKDDKGILDYFPNYSKEQVAQAVEKLPDNKRRIVYYLFGRDLSFAGQVSKSTYYIPFMNSIRRNITSLLDGKKITYEVKDKSIEDYFDGYSIDEIKSVIRKLPLSDRVVIEDIFGKELSPVKGICNKPKYGTFITTVKKHMISLLEGKELNLSKMANKVPKEKVRGIPSRKITDYFEGYSEEEVMKAIDILPDSVKAIVIEVFGENLDKFNTSNRKVYSRFMGSVKKKILDILEGKEVSFGKNRGRKHKSFFEYFEGYTLEQVKEVVIKLPKEDQEVIKILFGEDFSKNDVFDKKNYKYFYGVLKGHIMRMLETGNISFRDKRHSSFFDYFPEFSKEEIREALNHLSRSNIDNIHTLFGENLDKSNCSRDIRGKYNYFIKTIKPKLYDILNGVEIPAKKRTRKSNRAYPFFDYFPEFSEEEIRDAVNHLPQSNINSIHILFGDDLTEYNCSGTNKGKYVYFMRTIRFKIQDFLNGKVIPVEKKTEESITPSVPTIVFEDNKLDVTKDDKSLSVDVSNIAHFLKKELLKGTDFTKDELMIFIFRISLVEREDLTLEELASFYGISSDKVNEIALKVLMGLGERFMGVYNLILRDLYPAIKPGEKKFE